MSWCPMPVLGVFLDISGAFDNIKWRKLFEDMEQAGASVGVRNMIKTYLTNRRASMDIGKRSVEALLTRGCPQGSNVGPTLWRIAMDPLLKAEHPAWSKRIAYADDLVVTVAAQTRMELVSRAEEALDDLPGWAEERSLTFSSSKSVAMILKGDLVAGFTVPFGNVRLKTVDSVKYLGLTINSNWKFEKHIESLGDKSGGMFERMRVARGESWGLSFKTLETIYREVYIPRVVYAAEFWVPQTPRRTYIVSMGRLQRGALLAITKAYKTTSTDALQVVAGILPLDLEARIAPVRQLSLELNDEEWMRKIQEIRTEVHGEWQKRWETSPKGNTIKKYMPDVLERVRLPLELDPYVIQFLTGHGVFRGKLFDFKLVEDPQCLCKNGIETAEHVLSDCKRTEDDRRKLKEVMLKLGHNWPCDPKEFLSGKMAYTALCKFAKSALYARTDRD